MNFPYAHPFTGRSLPRRVSKAKQNSESSSECAHRRAVCKAIDLCELELAQNHSAEEIRKQLSKILNSTGFVHAGRMRRFLEFVVEETLAGRASQLSEYGVGLSVFERDASFEPGLDPIVRNDARRLRQKLLEYYQERRNGHRDPIVIDVPKGGYVPVFSSIPVQKPHPGGQYRLSIKLTRLEDGAEVFATQCDF